MLTVTSYATYPVLCSGRVLNFTFDLRGSLIFYSENPHPINLWRDAVLSGKDTHKHHLHTHTPLRKKMTQVILKMTRNPLFEDIESKGITVGEMKLNAKSNNMKWGCVVKE